MTAPAVLLPGTEVLVDTDRTCRQMPMRGIKATVHEAWHDEHTGRDFVMVCLDGHPSRDLCVGATAAGPGCRMPLLRADEVIAVPAQATP